MNCISDERTQPDTITKRYLDRRQNGSNISSTSHMSESVRDRLSEAVIGGNPERQIKSAFTGDGCSARETLTTH